MRYQFKTITKEGEKFLWTYPIYDSTLCEFAHHNLSQHHEYGTVYPIEINLVETPQLGLIYLGKEKVK